MGKKYISNQETLGEAILSVAQSPGCNGIYRVLDYDGRVYTCNKVFPDEATLYGFTGLDLEPYTEPTLWQVRKWLREEKGIEVVVEPRFSNYKRIDYDWMVYDDCSGDYALRAPFPLLPSYEAALQAGLDAALKLIEKGESK